MLIGACNLCLQGSGQVFPDFVVTPLAAITARFGIVPPAPPPAPPPRPSNCSQANYEVGTDYFNQDHQSLVNVNTIEECCQACANKEVRGMAGVHREGASGGGGGARGGGGGGGGGGE